MEGGLRSVWFTVMGGGLRSIWTVGPEPVGGTSQRTLGLIPAAGAASIGVKEC